MADKQRVSIVNCVSEALEMLRFSSEQLVKNAGTDNFDYIIVCWNTTSEVDKFIAEFSHSLQDSRVKVIRVEHTYDTSVGYVPNLRKMMNEGFDKAFELGDYGGLVNTDQAFYKNWLINLVKHIASDRVVTSKLIEVGRSRHLRRDFGLTEYGKFKAKQFEETCQTLWEEGKLLTEEMRGGFLNVCSLPYLFHRKMWEEVGPWELTLEKGTPDVNFFTHAHEKGYKFVMSGDSIAYHVGAAERGGRGRLAPSFSKGMPYE